MLRASVLAAFALASAADDWDAGTNGTCPRLWSACGGDVKAWTGRLDASELLVMVVTGQATWKKRVGAMILPTWGRRVSASLVLLSDACGSDAKVPTVTLRLKGLPPGAWGAFPRQARYEASNANGYELAQLRWPVGLQFAAWLAARRPFEWTLTLDDDAYLAAGALRRYVAALPDARAYWGAPCAEIHGRSDLGARLCGGGGWLFGRRGLSAGGACPTRCLQRRGEFSEAFPQSDKLLPHCLARDGVEFRASPNFLPLPPSFYVAYDDVRNNAVGCVEINQ